MHSIIVWPAPMGMHRASRPSQLHPSEHSFGLHADPSMAVPEQSKISLGANSHMLGHELASAGDSTFKHSRVSAGHVPEAACSARCSISLNGTASPQHARISALQCASTAATQSVSSAQSKSSSSLPGSPHESASRIPAATDAQDAYVGFVASAEMSPADIAPSRSP